jgi:hypothetical protein
MRRRKKCQEFIALSPTGHTFLITKQGYKWYLLGSAVDKKMTLPLTMSTSKKRILDYAKKEMGFDIL